MHATGSGVQVTDRSALQAAEQSQRARRYRERGRHPAIRNAREVVEAERQRTEAILAYRRSEEGQREREENQLQRLAFLLSTADPHFPAVWQALLNGERVPLTALNQKWVRAYGLRNTPLCSRCQMPDQRVTLADFNTVPERV